MTCPECRTTIVRHPLNLDFSEDLDIFRNIQEHAEAIIAESYNQNNTTNDNNNNENENNNENAAENNQQAEELEEIFEGVVNENVRYEIPSEQHVNFVRRFRRGQLNVRLGRRLLITAEGEESIHGCEAVIWFDSRSDPN